MLLTTEQLQEMFVFSFFVGFLLFFGSLVQNKLFFKGFKQMEWFLFCLIATLMIYDVSVFPSLQGQPFDKTKWDILPLWNMYAPTFVMHNSLPKVFGYSLPVIIFLHGWRTIVSIICLIFFRSMDYSGFKISLCLVHICLVNVLCYYKCYLKDQKNKQEIVLEKEVLN